MKSLSYLNKYLLKYKWRLLLGVLFIVLSNYFGVEMPKLVKSAVNDFLQDVDSKENFSSIFWMSLQIAGLYVLFSIGKGFFLFLTRQMIIIVSRFIEFDLKNEIYAHYQKLDFSFFKANKIGDLMNRISEDVSQVRMYLGPGLMYTINLAILSVLAIGAMLQINVKLTCIVLLPLPIMSILIYKVSSKMNLLSKKVQEEQSFLSSIVQESFSGIRVIKAYLREKDMITKFESSSEALKDRNMTLIMVNALFMPTIIFLIGFSILLTVYFGGLAVYAKEITPGDIVAFVFYVNMLTWPFASVGWVTSINQRAAASQTRINEFLQTKPEIVDLDSKQIKSIEKVEFKNVSFTYKNSGIQAIKSLSFTITKGETLGIVGKTGCGKSTVLNLLTRLVDVDSGEILINDINIKELDLSAFREIISIVPQDVFLFSDTIGNNIKFGVNNREVSEDELVKYTEIAHVYHNIKDFKDGFDTILGERGVNLSGGQKQRVSIARALIKNPQLLLLDDCLSAVDTETEDKILKGLKQNFSDTTSIMVSHRVSSIRNADKIIVIENGAQIEVGTHQELINLNGHYAEMYNKQLIENE